ncbi:MAG: O-antigen polymerase [Geobacteraceae bacterium]
MEATCFFTVCTLLFLWGSIRLTGTWFTPLSHYALRWFFLVFLVELNLVGYDTISPMTWGVVIASFIAFSCGALVPMLRNQPRMEQQVPGHIQDGLRDSIDSDRFLRSIMLLFILGTLVFLVYLFNINRTFGISNFLISGQMVRLAIAEGELPVGFHYLYIMELVGPLCFLYYLLNRKETPKWLFIVMFFSIISLFFTTGRTNMSKSIVWMFYILLFFELQSLNLKKFTKIAGSLLCVVVGIFFLIGLWKHGTFATNEFSVDKETAQSTPLMLPYIYMSVELPVLDKLLNDPGVEQQWGKLTFLPVIKVVRLFIKDAKAPSHVGEFYDTPIPANIATYLDLMYKDFWLIGPIVLPAILGFVSSFFISWLLFGRVTLAVFMINTILALTLFSSVSAANYMKPSYWFQVLVVIAISKFCNNEKSGSRAHRYQ